MLRVNTIPVISPKFEQREHKTAVFRGDGAAVGRVQNGEESVLSTLLPVIKGVRLLGSGNGPEISGDSHGGHQIKI